MDVRPRPPAAVAAVLQLALADHMAGRLDAAAAGYRKVLASQSTHTEALHRLGLVAYQQKRPADAVRLIGQAIAAAGARGNPQAAALPGMHNNLGLALVELGRLPEALASYDRAVALRPDHAIAHSNRGAVLAALGRLEEAAAGYARAAAGLDSAAAHLTHGVMLARLGRNGEALAAFERALARDADLDAVYIARAAVFVEAGRPAEALADYDRLLARRPALAEAHSGRGDALRALGQPEAALACQDRALALTPDLVGAHINRGMALAALGRRAEAAAAQARAVVLAPGNALAHSNLGRERIALGDFGAAKASLARALALDPGLMAARLNVALIDLLEGRLAEGLRGFEARWQATGFTSPQRGFAQPQWHGEMLAGRTLLLHAEQGAGDTIQFARYVPLAAGRGGPVVFEAPRPLLRLFAGQFPGVRLVARGEALPAFDLHCPLLSLAAVFGTDLASIPPPWPGPRAAPAPRAAAAAPRVGLAWSGNPKHAEDRSRSLPLAGLLPLLGCGAALFALQPEMREADRAMLAATPAIADLGRGLSDYADTAAALATLDLVISVDTSIAHLAASLGRPTWLLLPFVPDWRWMLGREDSPWYPAVRLFRQPVLGDWASVVARVRAALSAWVAGTR